MKPLTRSRITLLYLLVIVVLLGLISASSIITSRHMQSQNDAIVNDAIPLTNTANRLLTDLLNQETGIRGYQLTANVVYLEPYLTGKEALAKDLEDLRAYGERYPHLAEFIDSRAIPSVNALQSYYTAQIATIESGNTAMALAHVNDGKALMDNYREAQGFIQNEIKHIADDAYGKSLHAGQLSQTLALVGLFIAIGVGALCSIVYIRAHSAEAQLRKSEEGYRYMAESLEAQNEEIVAQQEEQRTTLEKLWERELELELITTYQEKLSGFMQLDDFLRSTVPALLDSLAHDAALVVIDRKPAGGQRYEVVYTCGYPLEYAARMETELFGPALRVFEEGKPLTRRRPVTGKERGLHEGLESAVDHYFPLFDDKQEVFGFLLLTQYPYPNQQEENDRLTRGLVRQFGLAFHAQMMNDDKRRQAADLEDLYVQLTSEKQFIEDQRDLINRILEAAHEGMVMTDAQGRIVFVNARMSHYMDLRHRVGDSLVDACRDAADTMPAFRPLVASLETLLAGEASHLTQRFSFFNVDQVQHAELYVTPVGGESEQRGFLFVFRDRTEEERIDEMKNEFISIVSHELRTPLASVLGFVEIMLNRDLPPDKQKKYMETIHKEAQRLSNLINDFLDLQRMESGRQAYHFAPVELKGMLTDIVEQWQDKYQHHIVVQQPEGELWTRGDINRLRQVCHNLLSNAIKYSPGVERVDVRLNRVGSRIRVDVQDYGLGIPENAHEQLFSKFFRVDNSDRRQIGGTGLGLAIVKEIVEAHDGGISFVSQMGSGSTFTFELDSYELPSLNGQIVILEDDDNLAKLVQVALGKLQLPSVQLRSAEEGALLLQRSAPGDAGPLLFIVDIHLEGSLTGWDFLAELNRHPLYYRTPVIVSTALEPPHDYYEKDIEKYLRKPFTMERLLQVARRLLEGRQNGAYVFPVQNKETISATLEHNGIRVTEMKEFADRIEVEIETPFGHTDDEDS
ncbi:CHASE3 domain-containing protein [Paenibacillus athensensis]|uniref:histidine kinase n=1 Tax=Paenibacillus athensensis TaxID=1967502 RepID=A0A4Y8Q9D0_9BACL|nr:ATP-binding protein [Paenibacillus athensensis]MCD1260037.1 CHASE3 domain-containing protein [Paenibacillus athensensis]